mgnify:FL=1
MGKNENKNNNNNKTILIIIRPFSLTSVKERKPMAQLVNRPNQSNRSSTVELPQCPKTSVVVLDTGVTDSGAETPRVEEKERESQVVPPKGRVEVVENAVVEEQKRDRQVEPVRQKEQMGESGPDKDLKCGQEEDELSARIQRIKEQQKRLATV